MSTAGRSITAQQPVVTIPLGDEDIRQLLDKLDADLPSAGQPRQLRFPYRLPELRLFIQQPGMDVWIPYSVPTRWISRSGLSFLHGGFVHQTRLCYTLLTTLDGARRDVVGRVRDCRCVEGRIHEIELLFLEEIDPALYCVEAAGRRVLLAENDRLIAQMTTTWLKQLNADVDHVASSQCIFDCAVNNDYDLILMDLETPGIGGFDAVAKLRNLGYKGAIVAITSQSQPADEAHCLEAGCNQVLATPFGRQHVETLLRSLNSRER